MKSKKMIDASIARIEAQVREPELTAIVKRMADLHDAYSDHSAADGERDANIMTGRALMIEDLLEEIERGWP